MTDPVGGVSGTKETHSGGSSFCGGGLAGERKKRKSEVQEHDLVEISQDARDRLSGKKRRSILEYLKDLLS
ncbi:MAG: hypothetical protein PHD54_15170 [Desulfuromonadaceae bacterium]|nr:hypothetical protein [Desulfuromonadaceae bacterium]